MKQEAWHIYRGRHVIVLGLAKSGFSAAKLLLRLGARVTVNERKQEAECEGVEQLRDLGAEVVCGHHPSSLLDQEVYMIVKNPGIPYDIPFLLEAERRDIPIVTEVELAYKITEAPIIGITGSNGKTTTTTLVHEMLVPNSVSDPQGKEQHRTTDSQPLIAGNIGTVFCEVAERATSKQWIVAELSSFQLLGTDEFRPRIAVLLNIFEAHLDYHHTLDHYMSAKLNIFKNQGPEDVRILNYDQEETKKIGKGLNGRLLWFSTQQEVQAGVYIRNRQMIFRDHQGREQTVIPVKDIVLPGAHNLENILAAVCAAMSAGGDVGRIRHVLRSFHGVPHRLQFVRELNGVRFYNDSKATNIISTQKAVLAFGDSPVILIAGGLDRGHSFSALTPALKSRAKALIVYGQVAERLAAEADESGLEQIERVETIQDAVQVAHRIATEGDTVLLSPACASWDQFKSFEERGDMFTHSVHMLK